MGLIELQRRRTLRCARSTGCINARCVSTSIGLRENGQLERDGAVPAVIMDLQTPVHAGASLRIGGCRWLVDRKGKAEPNQVPATSVGLHLDIRFISPWRAYVPGRRSDTATDVHANGLAGLQVEIRSRDLPSNCISGHGRYRIQPNRRGIPGGFHLSSGPVVAHSPRTIRCLIKLASTRGPASIDAPGRDAQPDADTDHQRRDTSKNVDPGMQTCLLINGPGPEQGTSAHAPAGQSPEKSVSKLPGDSRVVGRPSIRWHSGIWCHRGTIR